MKSDVWGICCENIKRKCNKTDDTNSGVPAVVTSQKWMKVSETREKILDEGKTRLRRILHDVEFSIFTIFSHFPALSLFFENSTSRRKPGKTFDEKNFPSPTPAWSENIFSPKLKIIYAKIDLAPSRWESIKEEFAQWWFSFVGAIWIFSFIKALIVFLKLERAAVVSERFNEIYLFHCRCLSGQ